MTGSRGRYQRSSATRVDHCTGWAHHNESRSLRRGVPSPVGTFVTIGTMLAGNTVEVERRSLAGLAKVRVTLAKYHTLQSHIASNRPKAIGGLRVDHASLAVQRGAFAPTIVPDGVLIRDVEPGSPQCDRRREPKGDNGRG